MAEGSVSAPTKTGSCDLRRRGGHDQEPGQSRRRKAREYGTLPTRRNWVRIPQQRRQPPGACGAGSLCIAFALQISHRAAVE
jgi:hypothetical protein